MKIVLAYPREIAGVVYGPDTEVEVEDNLARQLVDGGLARLPETAEPAPEPPAPPVASGPELAGAGLELPLPVPVDEDPIPDPLPDPVESGETTTKKKGR